MIIRYFTLAMMIVSASAACGMQLTPSTTQAATATTPQLPLACPENIKEVHAAAKRPAPRHVAAGNPVRRALNF